MSQQIDMDTLRTWLDERRPVTVLDIRDEESRAQWAIPGSLHVDAYDALRDGRPGLLATTELPHDRPLVAVCNAGRVSRTAADLLAARGIDARSLTGGMKAWSLAWNDADVPTTPAGARTIQVRRTGKGCLSYVVGSKGDALVIDPSLPPEVYLDIVRRQGWTLRHVLDTHIHADHLSRARQLATAGGATLRLPDQRRARFPFDAVHDGDTIELGDSRLTALHTPGHTDESLSYLLDGAIVFTGDTLFVRGVGRPDLHAQPAEAARRARSLFASLNRLRSLGPETLVLPAHASEPVPFDRRAIAARLGDLDSWLAGWLSSEGAFVDRLLAHVPPAPPNFSAIVALNEAGEQPAGDPADLEAGANRCAVA
jgi:glyoxylase-like metal-dependent hydrolase (beta-lactamase superfamily II)/rhodanese-related sulfurtransferase